MCLPSHCEISTQLVSCREQLAALIQIPHDERSTEVTEAEEGLREAIALLEATLAEAVDNRLHRDLKEDTLAVNQVCLFPERQTNGIITLQWGYVEAIEENLNETFATPLNSFVEPNAIDQPAADGMAGPSSEEDVRNAPVESRVLLSYAAPLSRAAIPCRHIRSSADCPYGSRCRFDHGRWHHRACIVPFTEVELKPYDHVLVKLANKSLWDEGTLIECREIEHSGIDGAIVEMKASNGSSIVQGERHLVDRRNILPNMANDEACLKHPLIAAAVKAMEETAPITPPVNPHSSPPVIRQSSSSSHSSTGTSDSEGYDRDAATRQLTAQNDEGQFAKWERHTKGIGSRIMRMMGYKMGDPLGHPDRPPELGPCLVHPIPIQVIPAGRSLDYIHEENKKREEKKNRSQQSIELSPGRSCVFKWMNSGVMEGARHTKELREKAVQQAESEHQSTLTKMNKSSEPHMRQELLKVDSELQAILQELQTCQNNLHRHSGSNGVSSLRDLYTTKVDEQTTHLRRLQERKNVLLGILNGRELKRRTRLF